MSKYKIKIITLGFTLSLIGFLYPSQDALAHPGKTASDGCHYCRTNCDYWGVEWNERHCHNEGYTAPAVTTFKPTSTPRPSATKTPDLISSGVKNPVLDAVRVVKVIDGDTIDVDISGTVKRVRLIGIDTPETVDPRKSVQCFGKEASEYTKKSLTGYSVYLANDPQGDTVDKYGRLLKYVYMIGAGPTDSFNEKLVSEGYAHAYTKFPFLQMEDFKKAESYAKENKKGLWAPDTCAPENTTPPVPHKESDGFLIRLWRFFF